ncbi:MAG TPA: peptide ABC transporter substrate-binding protein [Candidatus Elarobacter sp.]
MNAGALARVCAATAAALLCSCSPSAHDGAGGGAADTLVVAQQREPASLNPALENGTSSTQWGELLFQYMVKYDDRGQLVGDAATAVPSLQNGGIAKDGVTITYHLRPGLKFADGVPLTAKDAAWSVDAINDPRNNPQSRFAYDVVRKADAPNDTTLVLHLKRPFAPLLAVVLAPQGFPILPKHLLASLHDFNHIPFNSMPLGSGPYVVTKWARGDRVQMRANPYYYTGKPKIERIDVRFVPDPNTAMNLLRTKEVGGEFTDQDLGNYPLLQKIPGMRVELTPMNAVGAIIFNTRDPLTSDPRVRHALAMALDIPSMMQKTYRGAVRTHAAGRGLFIWAYDPKAYPDIPYDPDQARKLLDAAGWTLGIDGIRRKGGKQLDVLFILQAATPGDTIIGNEVAQYEKAVGVGVTLKAFNIAQLVAPVSEGGPVYGGKFQMALYPFVNGDDPDTTDQFACANVPPRGYNKSRICDPRLDALLARGQQTYDPARRKAIYSQLEARLYADLPIMLLYQRPILDVFTDRLQHQTNGLSTAWWNVGAWTLAP